MKYLLDTNVISELISRRPDPKVIAWIDALDPDAVYLSVITIGEIQKGVEKLPDTKRKRTIQEWLHNDLLLRFHGRITPITTSVALTWGTLTATLERNGRLLPAIDSLVAAIARDGGYVLVTRNSRDFAGAGIPVINPWDES
ncbi:MAG: type II toxin-antitoxin system VapC family toxin [Roseiflexus sp.]|nr:type II toxin-antitoxin system VapC family toxin [Roseiflexus sp.]MDW8145449.1 type II toxin-antitoxin system VapC family toxin [Roseiflexaceae bacterium]